MWFCCTFIFIFIGCEFTVKGQNTRPASFDHEIDVSVFRSLQDDVRNLKLEYDATLKQMVELTKELRIVQNDLRIEKERRINLEKETAFLKNASCDNQVQNITEILQSSVLLAKNSLTFTLGLDLKQQRYDVMREINKTHTEFENKIKATTTTISGIISTVTNIQRRIYFSASTNNDRDKIGSGEEIIVFTHVISHEGGGYNADTGIYTVPHNGVYVFTSHLASVDHGILAKIVVNGVSKVGIPAVIHQTLATSYGAAGNTVAVSLQQGDQVWVAQLGGGTLWTHVSFPYSTFSGFLLC